MKMQQIALQNAHLNSMLNRDSKVCVLCFIIHASKTLSDSLMIVMLNGDFVLCDGREINCVCLIDEKKKW